MSFEAELVRVPEPDVVGRPIKWVGGTNAITKVWGRGATTTYISTGVVDIKWADNPGTFMGLFGHAFEATVQSGVKGWTAVAGVFSTTTNTLRINLTDNTDTLANLAALQWVSLLPLFKMNGG